MRLPPFSALRCVEAVARLGSVTRAADELNVTQSAVSRQVIEFEKALGTPIFERDRGRLTPTPAGRQLSGEIGRAFRQIADAVAAVRTDRPVTSLTATMLPSVAAKWLAPRLTPFLARHPDIELVITASRHLVDFGKEKIDVAIRYGGGRWPGLEACLLGGEDVFPVCSPEYARVIGLGSVKDLDRAVLLHGDLPEDWRLWFHHAGVAVPPSISHGPRFGDDGALIEAAIRGSGIALGRSRLVQDDLATGRLTAPFPHRMETRFKYWFVWPGQVPEKKGRAELLEWLRAEFARRDGGGTTAAPSD
ncbi:MAG TPA: LysR substrate-binding domain-containing protein [Arenibaculum sp.]|nr:LysR substrate-binding domain-containing protein [Arenibaculum sp.]